MKTKQRTKQKPLRLLRYRDGKPTITEIPRQPWVCAVVLKDGDEKYDMQMYFMDAVSESEAIGRTMIALTDGREFRATKCWLAKPIPQ